MKIRRFLFVILLFITSISFAQTKLIKKRKKEVRQLEKYIFTLPITKKIDTVSSYQLLFVRQYSNTSKRYEPRLGKPTYYSYEQDRPLNLFLAGTALFCKELISGKELYRLFLPKEILEDASTDLNPKILNNRSEPRISLNNIWLTKEDSYQLFFPFPKHYGPYNNSISLFNNQFIVVTAATMISGARAAPQDCGDDIYVLTYYYYERKN